MNVAVHRSSDHEDQLAGCAVGRLVVYAGGHGDRRQSRSLDSLALRVRDRDLHTDGCRAHLFTFEDALLVSGYVLEVSALFVQLDQAVDRVAFC